MRGFLKGVLVGATATAVLAGGTVLAGSGVGAVFSLGQTNRVPATTTLSGAVAGSAQLVVVNTDASTGSLAIKGASSAAHPTIHGTNSGTGSGIQGSSAQGIGVVAWSGSTTGPAARVQNAGGGPGVRIDTTGGAAPLLINTTTRVAGLNADMVDGYSASDLGRVAMRGGWNQHVIAAGVWKSLVSVSVRVPTAGFVLVQAQVAVRGDGCSFCRATVILKEAGTLTESPGAATDTTTSGLTSLSRSWVFQADPGKHTYQLVGAISDAGLVLENAMIIAQFVPFGAEGSSTSMTAAPGTRQKVAEKAGTVKRPAERRRR